MVSSMGARYSEAVIVNYEVVQYFFSVNTFIYICHANHEIFRMIIMVDISANGDGIPTIGTTDWVLSNGFRSHAVH